MANIELNYFDGSTYQVLYPKIAWDNNSGGTINTTNIPNLDASKITSGTFSSTRIPTLAPSKLTSGAFGGNKGEEYIFPGNLRVGGTGSNSDAYIRIGDGDYVHFHEDSDDNLTIKAKRINFLTTSTPGLTNNGNAIGGINTATGSYKGTQTAVNQTFNHTGFKAALFLIMSISTDTKFLSSNSGSMVSSPLMICWEGSSCSFGLASYRTSAESSSDGILAMLSWTSTFNVGSTVIRIDNSAGNYSYNYRWLAIG